MNYEECWHNSLNRYLAIMDTRTDHIPEIVEEIIKPIPIDMPSDRPKIGVIDEWLTEEEWKNIFKEE